MRLRDGAALTALIVLGGCANDSDQVVSPGGEPTAESSAAAAPRDCQELASSPPIGNEDSSLTLVRSVSTTEGALADWLMTRNGPDGPAPFSPKPPADPRAPAYVCVFKNIPPPAVPGPDGHAPSQVPGVRVLVTGGKVITDALGETARLARRLDSLKSR